MRETAGKEVERRGWTGSFCSSSTAGDRGGAVLQGRLALAQRSLVSAGTAQQKPCSAVPQADCCRSQGRIGVSHSEKSRASQWESRASCPWLT